MLQFILPNLTVEAEGDLEGKWPDGTLHFKFKNGIWEDFIHHMDDGLRLTTMIFIKNFPSLDWFGWVNV